MKLLSFKYDPSLGNTVLTWFREGGATDYDVCDECPEEKKKKIEERERETEREKYRMGAPYYLCIYLLIFCYIYTNSELTNNNNKKQKAFNTHDIHALIN